MNRLYQRINQDVPIIYADFEAQKDSEGNPIIFNIGAIKKLPSKKEFKFNMLANPGTELDSEIVELTGIKSSDLVDAKPIKEVWQEFFR